MSNMSFISAHRSKHPAIILFTALLLLAANACVKQSHRSDTLDISFKMSSTTFYNGDEFSFTIKSNHKALRVISFDFPLVPSLMKEDKVYDIPSEGLVISAKLSIPKTQKGTFSICIEDVDTGQQKTFESEYTAYTSSNIEIVIENEPAGGSLLRYQYNDVPAVIEGDDFSFIVHSRLKNLTLKNFNCEFNDGQLKGGEEITFNEFGEKRYTFKSVNVDYDAFNKKCEMSLTFHVPETQIDTTVTAEYIRLRKFTPSVTLEPSTLVYNSAASLKFAANRQKIELVSHKEPDWFEYEDSYLKVSDLGENLKASINTKPLVIPEGEGDGSLEFEIKDTEYTGRTEKIVVPYTIARNIPPQDISLDYEGKFAETSEGAMEINQDELIHVKVSTSTKNSDNLYSVSVVKTPNDFYSADKDVSLFAPKKGESRKTEDIMKNTFSEEASVTDGDFFIKTNTNFGFYRISVSAKNDSAVSRDIPIYVKNCYVVFVVEMEQYDIDWAVTSFGYSFHNWWYGLPLKMSGYFASWENTESPAHANYIRIYGLDKYLAKLTRRDEVKSATVKWSIDFGPTHQHVPTAYCNEYKANLYIWDKSSPYFWERNKWGEEISNNATPASEASELKYEQLPNPGEGTISGADKSSVVNGKIEKFSLSNAMEMLKRLDCKGDIYYSRHPRHADDMFYSRPSRYWDHFNFNITSIDGLNDVYKVKYILYAFKGAWKQNNYWWQEIDKVGVLVDAETGNTIL